jgi:putative transposase
MLAKHVADASWAQLTAMLDYKAASAGVEIVRVDPRRTSQTCPACGTVAAKTLSDRVHRCQCACVLDRDVAAAKVVHFRLSDSCPERAVGR